MLKGDQSPGEGELEMNPEWFGPRLRELRDGAGLTQQQLAERAGLTREGIAQLETGRREPAWRTVLALCQALGAEPGDFIQPPTEREASRGRPRKVSAADVAPATEEPAKGKAKGKGQRGKSGEGSKG